jgi:hypothetical protein
MWFTGVRECMLAPIIVLCIVHPVCGFGDDSTPKVYIENYSAWRYFNLDSWPGNSWMMPWFDDTAWKTGGAYLATKQETRGQEISTTLPSSKSAYHTYYFRKTFIVEDVSQVTRMSLNVDYDDAYVVYINGQKVASSNFACDWHRHKAVCWPYPHHSLIDTNADAPSEPRFPQVDLSWEQMDYLVDGVNHIAVAVKQGVPESTDAAFMLTLYGYEKKRMFPSLLYLLLPAIISVFVLDVAYTWWKRARLPKQLKGDLRPLLPSRAQTWLYPR